MLLSAKFLVDVADVNDFDYAPSVDFTEGDAFNVYFQLVDTSRDLRYMPAVGALLTATIDNIDDAKKIARACTQPFAQDPSIWQLTVFATDPLRGTSNFRLQLTEGVKITRGMIKSVFRAFPNSSM